MMGEQRQGGKGASWRALDAMVPADHILRRIDRLLDMGELRNALIAHYSQRGRPSVAPELLIRMALIGRLYGITSERRLCEEVRFNLTNGKPSTATCRPSQWPKSWHRSPTLCPPRLPP